MLDSFTEFVGEHAEVLGGLEGVPNLPEPSTGADHWLGANKSPADKLSELRFSAADKAGGIACRERVLHGVLRRATV